MIRYTTRRFHPTLLFQRFGSVLPFSASVALPCATLSVILKIMIDHPEFDDFLGEHEMSDFLDLLNEPIAYSGFSALVGFFMVFRTQQAYHRFQSGATAVHEMRGEWFDSASSLVAFCKYSECDVSKLLRFQHKLVRLFSILHACALADLEGEKRATNGERADSDSRMRAYELPLIDVEGLDRESLIQIQQTDCKVELVYQWIQQIVVENVKAQVLSIPPPILTRAFQELSNGMVKYHDAMVIAHVPFPFPYMQTSEILLILHWVFTPLLMCTWTVAWPWTFSFCFISVLFLWSLNAVACELENPFGEDPNDLDALHAQTHLNNRLLLLLRPSTFRTPKLSEQATLYEIKLVEAHTTSSLSDVWRDVNRTSDAVKKVEERANQSIGEAIRCNARGSMAAGDVPLKQDTHGLGALRSEGTLKAVIDEATEAADHSLSILRSAQTMGDIVEGARQVSPPGSPGPGSAGRRDKPGGDAVGQKFEDASAGGAQASAPVLPKQWSPRRWHTEVEHVLAQSPTASRTLGQDDGRNGRRGWDSYMTVEPSLSDANGHRSSNGPDRPQPHAAPSSSSSSSSAAAAAAHGAHRHHPGSEPCGGRTPQAILLYDSASLGISRA